MMKFVKDLRNSFEQTAEWRRENAEEYPSDERNAAAAKMLDELASTVGDVDDALLRAYAELSLFGDGSDVQQDVKKHSEMLREIGFHAVYKTATEFVQTFINCRRQRGHTPLRLV
jgi:hypothetical protein